MMHTLQKELYTLRPNAAIPPTLPQETTPLTMNSGREGTPETSTYVSESSPCTSTPEYSRVETGFSSAAEAGSMNGPALQMRRTSVNQEVLHTAAQQLTKAGPDQLGLPGSAAPIWTTSEYSTPLQLGQQTSIIRSPTRHSAWPSQVGLLYLLR